MTSESAATTRYHYCTLLFEMDLDLIGKQQTLSFETEKGDLQIGAKILPHLYTLFAFSLINSEPIFVSDLHFRIL